MKQPDGEASPPESGDAFTAERAAMVRDQLAARGIASPAILAAFMKLPRHWFVPEQYAALAYGDRPLRIGYGQTISQPYMVALMTDELNPLPGQRVLEVGTGSGYQTALLAMMGATVFSVERVAELASSARKRFAQLGIQTQSERAQDEREQPGGSSREAAGTIDVLTGDGTLGWPEAAPFDRILVAAGAPSVPEALEHQLAMGGRLVCPVGDREKQVLVRVSRTPDGWVRDESVGCLFVPLIGEEGWKG